jgi:hypothetical protein
VRDIKDMIGVLLGVLDGGEITQEELSDLAFEAEGELLTALNETYILLLEFAHDRDMRRLDSGLGHKERMALQECLNRIVRLSDNAL